MVFSSHLFLFWFLPAILAVYYALPRKGRNLALTASSLLFYGWGNPAFLAVLLASTLLDWVCGLVLVRGLARDGSGQPPVLEPGGPRTRRQKITLAVSISANLLLLGFFKYFNFAVDSYQALADWLGLGGLPVAPALRVVLPLGISFYTFQSMSYAIDVYRGDARAMPSLLDFLCFETMFPQLVAGPIVRFSEIAEQLRARTETVERFARGVAFFACGLAKKVLVANPLSEAADAAFAAGALRPLEAWTGLVSYAFQIYFDFSGYSDMAVGLGLMFGFVFARNFDAPYRSGSLTEFWRRWHLSLSTWLRDYLYRPLGGNRKGAGRTYLNLFLVMLLGGLWHGAAWNFLIWGAFHGAWLAVERAAGKDGLWRRLPGPARVALTFLVVLFSWVFFRAPSPGAAGLYFSSLFGLAEEAATGPLVSAVVLQPAALFALAVAAVVTWGFPQTWTWTRNLGPGRASAALALLVLSVAALSTQRANPFIYFIF